MGADMAAREDMADMMLLLKRQKKNKQWNKHFKTQPRMQSNKPRQSRGLIEPVEYLSLAASADMSMVRLIWSQAYLVASIKVSKPLHTFDTFTKH